MGTPFTAGGVGCQLMQPLWKSGEARSAKLKSTIDPALPLLGIYSKDLTSHSTNSCSSVFFAAVVTIASKWNQLRTCNTQWNSI